MDTSREYKQFLEENARIVNEWPEPILAGAKGKSILDTTPEDPPPLSCHCYPGCWAEHSVNWLKIYFKNSSEMHTLMSAVKVHLDYGRYVIMDRDVSAGCSPHLRIQRAADYSWALGMTRYEGEPKPEGPPPLSCDCYPGCWAEHSLSWYKVYPTASGMTPLELAAAKHIDYGRYVIVTEDPHLRVQREEDFVVVHKCLGTERRSHPSCSQISSTDAEKLAEEAFIREAADDFMIPTEKSRDVWRHMKSLNTARYQSCVRDAQRYLEILVLLK